MSILEWVLIIYLLILVLLYFLYMTIGLPTSWRKAITAPAMLLIFIIIAVVGIIPWFIHWMKDENSDAFGRDLKP